MQRLYSQTTILLMDSVSSKLVEGDLPTGLRDGTVFVRWRRSSSSFSCNRLLDVQYKREGDVRHLVLCLGSDKVVFAGCTGLVFDRAAQFSAQQAFCEFRHLGGGERACSHLELPDDVPDPAQPGRDKDEVDLSPFLVGSLLWADLLATSRTRRIFLST